MATTHLPVVLTSSSIDGRDEEVVEANAAIVNAMHHALLLADEMSPVAVRSCAVDFYLCQVLDGGFTRYAAMAGRRSGAADALVREGMAAMGAAAHLDLFNLAMEALAALPGGAGSSARGAGAVSDGVFRMAELDGEFEELLERENVTALNSRWLRGQPDLLVLDDEEVGPYIQRMAARVPDMAGRKTAAAGAAASRIAGSL
ncbi:hypothetical protein LFT44_18410 [Arthrobacter sp. FW306-05-C]|uniref:DMP19 family protein n=1 Tax=Arthrobacter sp. FW306-05-C TaxID=2879620 RepID=UPI001F31B61D|nr:hypothetical protein [Arthrobacter sp. FW306-05-C]UKA66436.1 hypothetical protein LFT44_18410 [Arthrobacter sp. FW306-05-C]